MTTVLATHHATRALATYLACMDLINLTVQYRYATITQSYRVQRVNGNGSVVFTTFNKTCDILSMQVANGVHGNLSR